MTVPSSLVPQSRDFFGLGLCAAGILALEGLYTGSLTGSGLSDSAVIPLMTQCLDFLGLSLIAAITDAGIGLNTSVRAGRCRCDCTSVPSMAQCIRIIAFFGQSGILVADVDGIALLCAGRRYRIALMPVFSTTGISSVYVVPQEVQVKVFVPFS